jgi:putative aminopeptidase FrvX
MSLPAINQEYFVDFLVKLLNIPSPTGFAEPAIAFVEKELSQYEQLELSRTRKGALVAKWTAQSDLPPVALTAHVDTLGAVVKEIKPNGRLKLSRIGGVQWNSVETEGVWVFTSKGGKIRGSVLIDKASGHIYGGEGGRRPHGSPPGREDHQRIGNPRPGNQHRRLRSVRSARGSDEWLHPLAVP